MNFKKLFFNNKRVKALWRILIFICFLSLLLLPLILVNSSHLQFLGASLILVFGLYVNSKYLDKRSFSDYGLVFKKTTLVHLLAGVAIGSMAVFLMIIIGNATGILLVAKTTLVPSFLPMLPFALKMLLVGILEETFFRGYLFTNLYEGFKSKVITNIQAIIIALIVSSLLFGLAHISTNHVSMASITLLSINGMVWCIPFIMTKNLGLSIGMHLAWNFTQTQVGFTMSGNKAIHPFYRIENMGSDLLTGGEYGPEAGLLGLLGFIAMLLLTLGYLNMVKE